jgi:hypothetical protein
MERSSPRPPMELVQPPERNPEAGPHEQLIYDLLDTIRLDWTGLGVKIYLVRGLEAIGEQDGI